MTHRRAAAYQLVMLRVLGVTAAVVLLASACGGARMERTAGDGSGGLVVREVYVTGGPLYIEGALTYVSVDGGERQLGSEVRLELTPGDHELKVWHRPCDGNCSYLDPPTDRCERTLTLAAGETILATIRNRPGSPCSIVLGRVGIAYAQTSPRDIGRRNGAVWFAQADGSHPVRLATGSAGTPPALSPDGTTVAFIRLYEHPRSVEVLTVPTVGGSPTLLRRIRSRNAFITRLTWSPDSQRLVTEENPGLFLLRRAPPAKAHLFVTQGSDATFSPDGLRIAYTRFQGKHSDIYVYEPGRRKPGRVTRGGRSIAALWGPDALAFVQARNAHYDVWKVPYPGAAPRRLTRTGSGLYPVAWSGDGSRLLAANPSTHNGRLWAVNGRTGEAHPVTDWVGDLFGQGLSRDGGTILAAIGCGGSASPVGRVETIPFSGGEPRVILNGPCRASWND